MKIYTKDQTTTSGRMRLVFIETSEGRGVELTFFDDQLFSMNPNYFLFGDRARVVDLDAPKAAEATL